jgi:hypothetical protein
MLIVNFEVELFVEAIDYRLWLKTGKLPLNWAIALTFLSDFPP